MHCAIVAGIRPLKLLSEAMKCSRLVELLRQRFSGSLPESWFPAKTRKFSSGKSPSSSGNTPWSRFIDKSSTRSLLNPPSDTGIEPSSPFPITLSVVRWRRVESSAGISPESRLPERSRIVSWASLVSAEGTSPASAVAERFRPTTSPEPPLQMIPVQLQWFGLVAGDQSARTWKGSSEKEFLMSKRTSATTDEVAEERSEKRLKTNIKASLMAMIKVWANARMHVELLTLG
ncbi:hypothetical protein IEQ34_001168 [Dendrobium chrysotoxum]|uniref:Uncharacterized protein n=1 Tax=Dendrobium chrysotoxum TaxID=161865 RepID=A0AAV7HQT3_DENCH|nr:hypothetical protein IEQ34_001168 [Dendrobium chrysotoxum]